MSPLFVIIMSLIEQVKSIIEPLLADLGEELVEATLFKKGGRLTLSLSIDKESGVNLDDCTEASRRISEFLDDKDLIREPYNLEVSSPGIERPLTKPAHFKRFIGSKVKIKTKEALEGQRNFLGTITAADDKTVTIIFEENEKRIEYADIGRANLKVDLKF